MWSYPRPPRVEETEKRIQVVFNDVVIADTRRSKRVLETSHPPVYYIPPADVKQKYLERANASSMCEWKGRAGYYTVTVSDREAQNAAWFYPDPTPAFASIKDHVAFYPQLMDACYVDGERVEPQPGGFCGASYLFQLYLLENFGQTDGGAWENDWTRSLTANDQNSIV